MLPPSQATSSSQAGTSSQAAVQAAAAATRTYYNRQQILSREPFRECAQEELDFFRSLRKQFAVGDCFNYVLFINYLTKQVLERSINFHDVRYTRQGALYLIINDIETLRVRSLEEKINSLLSNSSTLPVCFNTLKEKDVSLSELLHALIGFTWNIRLNPLLIEVAVFYLCDASEKGMRFTAAQQTRLLLIAYLTALKTHDEFNGENLVYIKAFSNSFKGMGSIFAEEILNPQAFIEISSEDNFPDQFSNKEEKKTYTEHDKPLLAFIRLITQMERYFLFELKINLLGFDEAFFLWAITLKRDAHAAMCLSFWGLMEKEDSFFHNRATFEGEAREEVIRRNQLILQTEAYILAINECARKKDFKSALPFFEKIISLNPDNRDFKRDRGLCFKQIALHAETKEEKINYFERALQDLTLEGEERPGYFFYVAQVFEETAALFDDVKTRNEYLISALTYYGTCVTLVEVLFQQEENFYSVSIAEKTKKSEAVEEEIKKLKKQSEEESEKKIPNQIFIDLLNHQMEIKKKARDENEKRKMVLEKEKKCAQDDFLEEFLDLLQCALLKICQLTKNNYLLDRGIADTGVELRSEFIRLNPAEFHRYLQIALEELSPLAAKRVDVLLEYAGIYETLAVLPNAELKDSIANLKKAIEHYAKAFEVSITALSKANNESEQEVWHEYARQARFLQSDACERMMERDVDYAHFTVAKKINYLEQAKEGYESLEKLNYRVEEVQKRIAYLVFCIQQLSQHEADEKIKPAFAVDSMTAGPSAPSSSTQASSYLIPHSIFRPDKKEEQLVKTPTMVISSVSLTGAISP